MYKLYRGVLRCSQVTWKRYEAALLNGHNKLMSNDATSLKVFNRRVKLMQKERAALNPDVELYDYLKDHVGSGLVNRLSGIKRTFPRVVDLGCGRGHIAKHLSSDLSEEVIMCDISPAALEQAVPPKDGIRVQKLVVDEEKLSLEPDSVNLVISCLSLHWVNDLPGTFGKIMRLLKNDGVFIGALFGSDTLFELRSSLQLAQLEREGGLSAHISPFTEPSDIGGLLMRAGFNMLTIDKEEIIIGYPSMFELMWDLQGMGENNAAENCCTHLQKDTMLAAAAIYENLYGTEGKVPATFQVISFIGWKPDASQPKPAPRGSGTISIKDIGRLDEIIEEYEKSKK